MSKAKYAVRNGNTDLGLIWEGENGGLMFIPRGEVKIDLNHDIQIRNAETCEDVWVDLRDVILNAIQPKKKTVSVDELTIKINAELNTDSIKEQIEKAMKNITSGSTR